MTLGPGERRSVRFAVAWDLPLVEFGLGRRWRKRYTRWWGTSGGRAVELAGEALEQTPAWREAIEAWQAPVIDDEKLPAWYRAALFNELYFLVDGGTFWEDGEETEPPTEDGVGRFALLECLDYPFYNTVDVNATASIALLSLWPELALRTVRDVATAIPVALPGDGDHPGLGRVGAAQAAGHRPARPRRAGRRPVPPPELVPLPGCQRLEGPRPEVRPGGLARPRRDRRPRAPGRDLADRRRRPRPDRGPRPRRRRPARARRVPDQTYDTWPMRGPSAYGGSLWLAALRAAEEIARTLGRPAEAEGYRARFEQARASFDRRLWRDGYYAYDGGGGPSSDSIMADQLAGQGFADASGLGDLVSPGRIETALRTIHRLNVGDFGDGLMGAVNGMRPDGSDRPDQRAVAGGLDRDDLCGGRPDARSRPRPGGLGDGVRRGPGHLRAGPLVPHPRGLRPARRLPGQRSTSAHSRSGPSRTPAGAGRHGSAAEPDQRARPSAAALGPLRVRSTKRPIRRSASSIWS